MGSFFCTDEHSVYKAFIPAHFLLVGKLVEKGSPQIQKDVRLSPGLEALVDGALRAVYLGQFTPRSTGSENPKNALEEIPIIDGRASSFSIPLGFGQILLDQFPLFVSQCTPSHSETPTWLGSLWIQNELSTSFGMTSRQFSSLINFGLIQACKIRWCSS